jgi:ferritin-like metal-binding protein YciE
MKVESMQDLYVHCLNDLYSAEKQLVEALPTVQKAANSKELKHAIGEHLKETKEHQKRLEEIFKDLEEKPGGMTCAAMEGLVKECGEYIETIADKDVVDAGLIAAAQKVEHYEIASYGTVHTFATMLGYDKHAEILSTTLEEEYAADEHLTQIAMGSANLQAIESDESMATTASKKKK